MNKRILVIIIIAIIVNIVWCVWTRSTARLEWSSTVRSGSLTCWCEGAFCVETRDISDIEHDASDAEDVGNSLNFSYTIDTSSEGEDLIEIFDSRVVFKVFNFVGAGQCDNNKLRLEKRADLIKIFFEQENCRVYTQRYGSTGEIEGLQPGTYIVQFYGSNHNKIIEREVLIE